MDNNFEFLHYCWSRTWFGFIGIFEIGLIKLIIDSKLSLSLRSSFENSIGAAALFSLIGQLLLILSLVSKKSKIVFLWIGFLYLTHNIFEDDNISGVSFGFGIPFLVCSFILFYKIIKDKISKNNFSDEI
ncbi:MAG TPA: hypothetical protein VK787_06690 [Puia sp.]|jgi:hypothetical protein|nr:hypothetical protein [Puia sp.]